MNNEMIKWTMKWWNTWKVQEECETHKGPSALAYDKMNIHVKGVSNYEEKMC